jgi:hypothetical protein
LATWSPILISSVSLVVSGLTFLMNRSERHRVMPKIKVIPWFSDQYKFGNEINRRKVISASIHNEGRELTNLKAIRLHTGTQLINAAKYLLDNSGKRIDPVPSNTEIPGFSEVKIYIDAWEVKRRDVGLTLEFGHRLEQHFYIPLNGKRYEQKQYFSIGHRLLRRSTPDVFVARHGFHGPEAAE